MRELCTRCTYLDVKQPDGDGDGDPDEAPVTLGGELEHAVNPIRHKKSTAVRAGIVSPVARRRIAAFSPQSLITPLPSLNLL